MALPGLRRIDHVGFTVPDLEQAHRFLVEVLGCEYLYTLGPFEPDGDWMETHLNVHRDTRMYNRWFRCGDQAVFEVFHYESPDQDLEAMPRNSDVGGHHVALYVDDLDAAVAYLHEQGLTVLGEPTVSKGPSEGQRWVYFLSPWGMQFELVSYPGRKAFDRAGGTAEAWAAHTAAGTAS